MKQKKYAQAKNWKYGVEIISPCIYNIVKDTNIDLRSLIAKGMNAPFNKSKKYRMALCNTLRLVQSEDKID